MLNRHYRIVFQPKDPGLYGKRRFGVGTKSLHKYIGLLNANTCLVRALKCKDDKCTIKLRKFGRVDIYVK